MTADMCQLCGEVWNRQNLTTIKIKNKNLNLCPDCLRDFRTNFNSILENIKPKIAHWVEHDEGYIDCSHCGCVAQCIEFADKFVWKKSKFCPDCGYQMESEDNNGTD